MADFAAALLKDDGGGYDIDERLYEEFIGNRILILNDEIDERVVEDYVRWILKWNLDDINIPIEKRVPIKIMISSPGGNVFDANIMIDIIEASRTPVYGIGMDLVASAAYIIYLACHTRYAFKNTAFLQHEGEIMIENSRSKAKNNVEFFDSQEHRAKEFILSKTNMTSEFYDDVYEQEFWMFSDRAKELGVVHKIVGEDCSIYNIFCC